MRNGSYKQNKTIILNKKYFLLKIGKAVLGKELMSNIYSIMSYSILEYREKSVP